MAFEVDIDQSDSDPMPYGQVDRAVKQTAAMIGERLGVTFQHALGGLVQFWELNGDPRELEALLELGKQEVVLPREQVARRFTLAMAVDTARIDPDDLHELRIVERRSDGYRVRGMSRYFKPLVGRVAKRLAGRAGGLASAEARVKKHGSAQPSRSGAASGPASVGASESASGDASSRRSTPEAAPNTAVSGQRSAVSGQPLETAPPSPIGIAIVAPDTPRATWLSYDFWRWAQSKRIAAGFIAEKPPRNLDIWWSEVLMTAKGDVDRVCDAFEEFGQSEHWESEKFPFRAFMSQWASYAPAVEV
jgi:hypothetical protein